MAKFNVLMFLKPAEYGEANKKRKPQCAQGCDLNRPVKLALISKSTQPHRSPKPDGNSSVLCLHGAVPQSPVDALPSQLTLPA